MPKRGTIILVPFPFTDLSGAKVRPALVISRSIKGEDMIVVFISSKGGRGNTSDIAILPTKENRLKVPSIIRCAKIATLEKSIAIGELGTIDQMTQKRVNQVLRRTLGI